MDSCIKKDNAVKIQQNHIQRKDLGPTPSKQMYIFCILGSSEIFKVHCVCDSAPALTYLFVGLTETARCPTCEAFSSLPTDYPD